MNTEFRKALQSDVLSQLEIMKSAFLPLFKKYKDEESPYNTTIEELSGKVENPFGTYLIISCDKKDIGGIYTYPLAENNREMYLCCIYILPQMQGNRIAQNAIKFVEDMYPECEKWVIDVPEREEKNIHLYKKSGYKPTGQVEKINELLTVATYEKISK